MKKKFEWADNWLSIVQDVASTRHNLIAMFIAGSVAGLAGACFGIPMLVGVGGALFAGPVATCGVTQIGRWSIRGTRRVLSLT